MKEITNEQIYLKVVEAGSFKKAAEQLNTEPSSVSRSISSLEKRLGIKLVERSTKRSVPTEAGQKYYVGLKKLLDEKQSLEDLICGTVNQPSGALKVAAPHDFGCQFVVPVLEQMTDEFPELTVEILLGSQFEDLKSQGIDVAIRIGELPSSSLICRRIGNVPRVMVASKGYIHKHGLPTDIKSLSKHNFIFYKKSLHGTPVTIEDYKFEMQGNFTVNSVSAVKQLVLDDKGIHIGPKWAFKEELDSERVVQLLPEVKLTSFPVHALYISRNFLPAKVKQFIQKLIDKYQGSEFC
ncbi:LysR family transcriptional regulator [Pseudoalteromonas sp. J010]|uniref:LysR family transcriptional regulator n=1 Tax=Pseudoalteromonas sp. J010 TaxID=998465 RepID=UPI000F64C952|nr:LysR family transcriptional regulator [Pseudoalteromonas sp. J010]RRS06809.1 LysR family transcriptional regulator [Pseudoalteromonas sp. J010]